MATHLGVLRGLAGNFASLDFALKRLGLEPESVEQPTDIAQYSHLMLPGVGSFKSAMNYLNDRRLIEPIRDLVQEGQLNIMGICLGAQLLLTSGTEGGCRSGLDLIPGTVRHLGLHTKERTPHTGWNRVDFAQGAFSAGNRSDYFYFNHNFFLDVVDVKAICASVEYGFCFPAMVRDKNVWGVQFHPEKSQDAGLEVLRLFIDAADG